jgi:glycosyltransferase involved in cell wall biosynthesis
MTPNAKRHSLAVVQSHVIEYYGPFFRKLAEHPEIDLTVYYESRRGVDVSYDPGFQLHFQWDRPLLDGYKHKFLASRWELIKELRQTRYDALLGFGWTTFFSWLAYLSCAAMRIPYLITGDSIPQRQRRLKHVLKRALLEPLFRKAGAFLTMGALNEQLYRQFGVPEEKFFLVPYSPDIDYFQSCAQSLMGSKETVRRQHGLHPSYPAILFAGKLVDRKRPLDLLKAYQGVCAKGIRASLVFCGDGQLRNELQSYAAQYGLQDVHFVGFKNQSEMPAIYTMCDFLVLPSDHEPWGIVLNEAMACGLPVIVSDQVGAAGEPRFIQDGRNAIVYSCGAVDELARGLTLLLTDDALRLAMSQSAVHTVGGWNYGLCVNGVVNALCYVNERSAAQKKQVVPAAS